MKLKRACSLFQKLAFYGLPLLSVSYVFCIIICIVIQYSRHKPKNRISVVQEPMDLPMLSLFITDFTQSWGAAAKVKWVNRGKLEIGPWCTAQEFFSDLGLGKREVQCQLSYAGQTFVDLHQQTLTCFPPAYRNLHVLECMVANEDGQTIGPSRQGYNLPRADRRQL
ncbi:hypothetical protein H2248_005256 [Termitomyces sp. 'cryptogamus']|nr:hypothetical protein H2248_005256 [Termitomyces sp. 'cryptogamus']